MLGQAPAGTTIENFRVSEKSADGNQTTQLRGAQAVFREDGQLALSDPRLMGLLAAPTFGTLQARWSK